MKKFASLIAACAAICLVVPGHVAQAFTPTGIQPLVVATQSFNVAPPSAVRFVVSAPEESLANDNNLVDIQLHRRVATRDSLQSIATGAASARVIDTVTRSVRTTERDAEGRLVLTANTTIASDTASSLRFSFDGIYPVTLRIRDAITNDVLASVLTFVNKRSDPTTSAPIPVTALVRLTAAPSHTNTGQILVTPETRKKVQHFVAFLATYSEPLTIGIQPEVVSSLALSPQPEDAQLLNNLRDQLRRFSVVTSTFMPTDVSVFAETQLDDEFIEQLRLGESTLSRYLPDVNIQRSTWIADAPVTLEGTQLLRKAGIASLFLTPVAQQGTTTSVPRSVMTRPDGRVSDYMSIVAVEPKIAAQLSQSTTNTSAAVVAYTSAAEVIMETDDLRAAGRTAGDVRVVVSSLNGEIMPGNALSTAARALIGSQVLSVVDMGTPYLVTQKTPVTNFSTSAPDNATDVARRFSALRDDLFATVSMTAETDPRRDIWAHLLAIGESTTMTDPQAYLDSLSSLLRETREAVTINTPGTITLSGRNSVIRLQLRNNSASQLSINVRLASAKLELDSPNRLVTLTPESTTELEVPAQALTNGRFPIAITVQTPEGGVDVVSRTTITARVNALAGYGQLVSISLLLVLAAWWWSHWRKGKIEAARATTV